MRWGVVEGCGLWLWIVVLDSGSRLWYGAFENYCMSTDYDKRIVSMAVCCLKVFC